MLTPAPSKNDQRKPQNEAAALRTLNAFAVELMSIPSAEDLFWYVAQNVVGQLSFVDCVIYVASDDQTELMQVAAMGEKNPFGRSIINPLKIPFGEGVTGRAAQDRQPVIVDDLLKDQNYIPDAQPARSEICVPLICKGRVLGVIDSEHPDQNAFGPSELEILTTIAAMTCAKLELLEEAERSNKRYIDLVESHAELSKEISNRKSLEAKLHQARKLESIGRLTGRFAHEFNNLLTVIAGNLELLSHEPHSTQAQSDLSDAQMAAQRGSKLIKDMLSFSQQTRLTPASCDMNELVCAASTSLKQHWAIDLELHLSDALPPVMLDADVFQAVLENIVVNARDAMEHDASIQVFVQLFDCLARSDLSLATPLPAGQYLRVSVKDSGAGIATDDLPKIFDPFFTTKPVGSGTGLGLSMALGFMQQSGGTIGVDSKLDHGSTIHLYFPV